MKNHLILLGDSIFDNAIYVAEGPAVIDQVRQQIPSNWQATLLAKDGNVTTDVPAQFGRMPVDATHVVLSVGGNDALRALRSLDLPQSSVLETLDTLSGIQRTFEDNYAQVLTTIAALNLPLLV
jgi:lysophospholipase L1-like esterase